MPLAPSDEELKGLLADAVEALFDKDSHLIKFEVSERAITHRLALHLTYPEPSNDRSTNLSGWDIDCEYNRDGIEKKRLSGLVAERAKKPRGESKGSLVYPDIIVHKRGTESNLLVVEVKNDEDEKHRRDHDKLRAYINDIDYLCGLFINLRPLFRRFGVRPPKDAIWHSIEQPYFHRTRQPH